MRRLLGAAFDMAIDDGDDENDATSADAIANYTPRTGRAPACVTVRSHTAARAVADRDKNNDLYVRNDRSRSAPPIR